MKLSSSVLLLAATTASADYVCPAMPSQTDANSLAYAYQIQQLLNMYYESVPVNASFFSGLPMADMMASNGMTLAENTVTNVEGLGKQAMLASQALEQAVGMAQGVLMPMDCNYMLPMALNASAHLMNAFYLEASLCGAFIGLADYMQSPTLNALSARLAAEHGIHAAAIRAMMQPVGFMPNSTTLTPAFTPDTVLSSGMEVGQLGDYLNKCNIMAPMAPCGGSVSFGSLLPMIEGQHGSSESGSNCGGASSSAGSYSTYAGSMPSATGSATPATYTGDGNSLTTAGFGLALTAVAMGWMMS